VFQFLAIERDTVTFEASVQVGLGDSQAACGFRLVAASLSQDFANNTSADDPLEMFQVATNLIADLSSKRVGDRDLTKSRREIGGIDSVWF